MCKLWARIALHQPYNFKMIGHQLHSDKCAKKRLYNGAFKWPGDLTLKDRRAPLVTVVRDLMRAPGAVPTDNRYNCYCMSPGGGQYSLDRDAVLAVSHLHTTLKIDR